MTDNQIKDFIDTKILNSNKISDYALETVLRRVLYYDKNVIDWQDFYQQIIQQMPEYSK